VRAWRHRRQLHVSIPKDFGSSQYRFTTDGKTWHEVKGRVKDKRMNFEFSVSNLIGRLEGFFVGDRSKTKRLADYSYTIPDKHDLQIFQKQKSKEDSEIVQSSAFRRQSRASRRQAKA